MYFEMGIFKELQGSQSMMKLLITELSGWLKWLFSIAA
jgi:hypothetical protein